MSDLDDRLAKLYAAIGGLVETNLAHFQPQVAQDGRFLSVSWDWSGGLSEAAIGNLADLAIEKVASLHHHLCKWLGQQHRSVAEVNAAMRDSRDLQIIYDLWNNNKHGYPPRDGGKSGLRPQLRDVQRMLQVGVGGQGAGPSSAFVMLTPAGPVSQVQGSGNVTVVVTGTVLDGDGAVIGQLSTCLDGAVDAWERLFAMLEIAAP